MNKLFLSVTIIFITFNLNALVDPPNYDFSLDALKVFMPGQTVKAMEEKYGKGEMQRQKDGIALIKFYVAQIRYKFPVFVQAYDGKSIDFFARLPSYFLHDIFHQSLINRLGPQDEYKKKGEHAIYRWTKKKGVIHTYSGMCTITCFTQYYSVSSTDSEKKFETLLNEMVKKQ